MPATEPLCVQRSNRRVLYIRSRKKSACVGYRGYVSGEECVWFMHACMADSRTMGAISALHIANRLTLTHPGAARYPNSRYWEIRHHSGGRGEVGIKAAAGTRRLVAHQLQSIQQYLVTTLDLTNHVIPRRQNRAHHRQQ